jgi:drug/metabolite transporter (DMT)-like permease
MPTDSSPGPLEFCAALGSALSWSIAALLFARLMQRGDGRAAASATGINLFKNSLAAAVFVAVFLLRGESWPEPAAWGWLALSGVFGFAIGDSLYLAALPRSGVQIATMVSLVHVPATALLDWAFVGRALAPITLVWMGVVLFGVWLVVTERPAGSDAPETRRAVRSGALFALCAAVSQSVGVVLGHQGMSGASLFGGTLVRLFAGILGVLAGVMLAGLVRSALRAECATLTLPMRSAEVRRPLAFAALFGSVLGLPLFHFALRGLPSGVASLLFATTPLFTLPLGFLFGERHGPRAWIGTAIGFGGVAGLVQSL